MQIGDQAPEFALPDQQGNMVKLSDFTGQKVVLYFYPKDNTPGCTRQACAFAAAYDEFKKRDLAVIGISKDSAESHRKFAEKHNLPFILLADPDLQATAGFIVPDPAWQGFPWHWYQVLLWA